LGDQENSGGGIPLSLIKEEKSCERKGKGECGEGGEKSSNHDLTQAETNFATIRGGKGISLIL